ncbi:hypothetical protein C8A00DRAFT_11805 [Chaetomidium leptoderma]|uniref:Major facilitator superfamily (MFS) profile domain-containing protein n=1 Tax=Chaetomidium leptoderma TaxID=669021 RepID=A0AAN6VU19_9PEZI|nr:hypothetical protein C8A00DRAFT_11805 [Chaetomidium leptoderma]
MTLTMKSHRNPDAFPTVQLFLLAIVRLAEPVALTSIFPYAWALVKRFKVGNEDDAAFYAGLLISSFSLAEALMGMYWGGLSDRIGRKPVLLLGCVGTMFSMVVVGFAENIWVALLGRAFGGLLNGNIGVIQTMVGELVTKPEHERIRANRAVPFVWSVGTIIGPMIGGLFADPTDSYPGLFPKGSIFERFPYLLPNLICAGLLLVSIVLGYFLLEESHPDMQPRVLLPDDTFLSENTPLIETSDAMKRPAVDLRDENYGTMRSRDIPAGGAWATKDTAAEKQPVVSIFCKRIMAVILSLSIFTYHSMTFDHLLPIFFEDDRTLTLTLLGRGSPFYSPGGLGLSLQAVGVVMAVQGVIALFMQAVVFPVMAERLGIYRLFVYLMLLHPVVYLLVPALLYVPEGMLYPAIYFCLAVRNFFSILLYPLLLILIKEATPSSAVLGRVNGLAASAGAACRMAAPPVAGYLYAVGRRMDCTALAWYGSAIVAVIGAVQCFSVKRERVDKGKRAVVDAEE